MIWTAALVGGLILLAGWLAYTLGRASRPATNSTARIDAEAALAKVEAGNAAEAAALRADGSAEAKNRLIEEGRKPWPE